MEKEYTFNSIDLCRQCGGTGVAVSRPDSDTGTYDLRQEICSLCHGSGLVRIEKQIKVIISPYNPRGGVK